MKASLIEKLILLAQGADKETREGSLDLLRLHGVRLSGTTTDGAPFDNFPERLLFGKTGTKPQGPALN